MKAALITEEQIKAIEDALFNSEPTLHRQINSDRHEEALAIVKSLKVSEPVAWANRSDLVNFDMKVRTSGSPLHTFPLYAKEST